MLRMLSFTVASLFAISALVVPARAVPPPMINDEVTQSINACAAFLVSGQGIDTRRAFSDGHSASYGELARGMGPRMCSISLTPARAGLAEIYLQRWPGPLAPRPARPPLPGFVSAQSFCTVAAPGEAYDVLMIARRADESAAVSITRLTQSTTGCPAG